MILSQKGKEFLKAEERFISCPYKDSVGVPTVGIGTTIYPNGKAVTMSDPCVTVDKAYEYLQDHVNKRIIAKIENLIKKPLNQNQTDAVISLTYNIGAGVKGFAGSTLLKRINTDPNNRASIEDGFLMWKFAGGKPILEARRRREVKLYFS